MMQSRQQLERLASYGDERAIEILAKQDQRRDRRVERDMGEAMFAALKEKANSNEG